MRDDRLLNMIAGMRLAMKRRTSFAYIARGVDKIASELSRAATLCSSPALPIKCEIVSCTNARNFVIITQFVDFFKASRIALSC